MTGYQKLKEERDGWEKIAADLMAKLAFVENRLWEIANQKGPEVVEAPRIALAALAILRKNENTENGK